MIALNFKKILNEDVEGDRKTFYYDKYTDTYWYITKDNKWAIWEVQECEGGDGGGGNPGGLNTPDIAKPGKNRKPKSKNNIPRSKDNKKDSSGETGNKNNRTMTGGKMLDDHTIVFKNGDDYIVVKC